MLPLIYTTTFGVAPAGPRCPALTPTACRHIMAGAGPRAALGAYLALPPAFNSLGVPLIAELEGAAARGLAPPAAHGGAA